MKRAKSAICLAPFLVLVAAGTGWGQIVAFDTFESYTAGANLHSLSGGSGYIGAWDANQRPITETTIFGTTLTYSNGQITFSGGNNAVRYVAGEGGITDGLMFRQIPTQSSTVYLSFLYNNTVDAGTAAASADDFMQFGFGSSATDGNPNLSALDRNTEFQVRTTENSANSFSFVPAVTSTAGQTYFIVLKAEKGAASATYNNITMWVNPDSKTEGSNTVFRNTTLDSGLASAVNFAIRKAFQEAGDTYVIDNVRVATTWDAATGLAPTAVANGGYVFDESTLSVNLNGAGSTDLDGTVNQYLWMLPDAANVSSSSAITPLAIGASGLSSTIDVDTISLQVTDNDSRTSTNVATTTISYDSTPPTALGVTQQIFQNGDNEFTVTMEDLDLSVNGVISNFEQLLWELSANMATNASEVGDGDGFAGGTVSPTSDFAMDMATVLTSDLLAEFGGAGSFTAYLNVRDLAGGANDPASFSSLAFTLLVTPEPGSVAMWSMFGLILVGLGYYRFRSKG